MISPIVANSKDFNGHFILNEIVEKLKSEGFDSYPSLDINKYYPPCTSDLLINKMFGSWKTVEVNCHGSNNWKIAVRTNINSLEMKSNQRITKNNSGQVQVLALNKTVRKDKILQKNDLSYVSANNNLGGDIFFDMENLLGRTVKTHMNKGTVLRGRHLKPNWIILKNQIISIEHKIGNITIKASGIAQEHGQLGEKILVSNINSGKKVWGWIENGKKIRTYAKIN
jgi:flagella basal body P-ring formation protein FlgA